MVEQCKSNKKDCGPGSRQKCPGDGTNGHIAKPAEPQALFRAPPDAMRKNDVPKNRCAGSGEASSLSMAPADTGKAAIRS